MIPLVEKESNEKIELKKLFRLQKDGIINVKELILKSHDRRTNEDKSHIMVYLKFKVPFFEAYEKDLVYMIAERLETRHFSQS
jgi:hypothetical protein